jgi:hypothetical protein
LTENHLGQGCSCPEILTMRTRGLQKLAAAQRALSTPTRRAGE